MLFRPVLGTVTSAPLISYLVITPLSLVGFRSQLIDVSRYPELNPELSPFPPDLCDAGFGIVVFTPCTPQRYYAVIVSASEI